MGKRNSASNIVPFVRPVLELDHVPHGGVAGKANANDDLAFVSGALGAPSVRLASEFLKTVSLAVASFISFMFVSLELGTSPSEGRGGSLRECPRSVQPLVPQYRA